MKCFINFITCLLIFCCSIVVKAQTEPFIDDCNHSEPCPQKTYVNLIKNIDDFSAYSAWNSCEDKTALSMTANKAWVVYHVNNAEKIYVELFSDGGTFATINKDGDFQIGLTDLKQFSNVYRCQYQQGEDKVYIRKNGLFYSLKSEKYMLNFIEDHTGFEKDDPYYGINAEVSSDGATYRYIDLHFDKIEWQNYENYGNYFREFYSSSVPDGTAYIKLTLYGYNRIPGGWGDMINYPYLSKVVITRTDPASSSSISSSEDSPSSDTPNSEPSFSHSSQLPVSHGAPDCENKKELLPSSIGRNSKKSSDYSNKEVLKKAGDFTYDHSKNSISGKIESQHDDPAAEYEEKALQPPLDVVESKEEEQSMHRLRSLYQEKPNQKKTVIKEILVCGLTVSPVVALLFLLKPH